MRALRMLRRLWRQEFGQGLVLAALVLIVILGFAAMAVDVGYWFSQKAEVQNAVDAAALAGARELPNDWVAAEAKAREYLLSNGVDTAKGDTISITFRCTSTYQVACDPTTNHWDTIVVTVERQVQAWFARVFDIQHALISDVHAAGCNGPCGGAAYQPVDVVEILDRTYSMMMPSSKLANAKAGGEALLEYFQPSLQRVGLAVLPPSASWANPCPPSLSSNVWLPVNLSNDYQLPGGALDHTNSRLVKTIDCLTSVYSGGYETNLGEPMKAAADELVANGRPDMTWGIILLSDGAANIMPAYDTGYLNCTTAAPAPGGHGDGFEHNATNACADDTNRAEDSPSGTNDHTTCGDSGKDRHIFSDYGISVPSGNRIDGIAVRLDAWVDSATMFSTRRMCVELSWDGGLHWTSSEQTSSLGTSQATYTLGGNGDTWGRTWTLSELSNANFRVRVTDVYSSYSRTFYLDWAAVKVYYSPATSGPCAYAAQQADAAKAAGIEVFTIGYGLSSSDLCTDTTGVWHNQNAMALLQSMATDANHFFNQPSTADLRPVFEVIGSHMATGSRLVE